MIYLVMLSTGRGMDRSVKPLRGFYPDDETSSEDAKNAANSFVEHKRACINEAVAKHNHVENAMLDGFIVDHPFKADCSREEFEQYETLYSAALEKAQKEVGYKEDEMPDDAEVAFAVYIVEVPSGDEV